jgi:hypothetical protein
LLVLLVFVYFVGVVVFVAVVAVDCRHGLGSTPAMIGPLIGINMLQHNKYHFLAARIRRNVRDGV